MPERPNLWREDFRERVERFAGGSLRNGVSGQRERSYDHCYNYFRSDDLPTRNLESSCAVLGFYLASWGMYRGSSFLFQKTNSTHLVPVVEYTIEHRHTLGRLDVDQYTDETARQIRDACQFLSRALLPAGAAAVTLITKIMIGVFGCVPAYDTYFRQGIREVCRGLSREKYWRLTPASLDVIASFYEANRQAVDALHEESVSWRFADVEPTGARLSKAKIIDMYFFNLGYSS